MIEMGTGKYEEEAEGKRELMLRADGKGIKRQRYMSLFDVQIYVANERRRLKNCLPEVPCTGTGMANCFVRP